MPTSGTVGRTVFNTRKVIDHAFRRCKLTPQQVVAEHIETALDLLWLYLSTIASKGVALWAVQKEIIPMYGYVTDVPLPVGTVDVLDVNLRKITRPTGFYTSSEGFADDAFDGNIETAVTQLLPGGWIQIEFDATTQLTNFGILSNVTGIWSYDVEVSDDGLVWQTVYSAVDQDVVDQEWFWFDLQGIPPKLFCRLQAGITTTLDVAEFVAANNPQEIPLALINTDSYDNQPNKAFPGRPTEYRYDKQRRQPVMNLWPTPAPAYTFYQLVARVQRYIQDVGTMVQEVEVPQRWYLAIICELARQLAYEIKEVDVELIPGLSQEASNQLKIAWDSESDSSPTYLRVNISPYTR
jgi:hypothetical protein